VKEHAIHAGQEVGWALRLFWTSWKGTNFWCCFLVGSLSFNSL